MNGKFRNTQENGNECDLESMEYQQSQYLVQQNSQGSHGETKSNATSETERQKINKSNVKSTVRKKDGNMQVALDLGLESPPHKQFHQARKSEANIEMRNTFKQKVSLDHGNSQLNYSETQEKDLKSLTASAEMFANKGKDYLNDLQLNK